MRLAASAATLLVLLFAGVPSAAAQYFDYDPDDPKQQAPLAGGAPT